MGQILGASYIEPGSPWQNPWIESFNARLRDEVLDTELFSSLAEAKLILAEWLEGSNNHPTFSVISVGGLPCSGEFSGSPWVSSRNCLQRSLATNAASVTPIGAKTALCPGPSL
jgi:hypothetical protein